jgi:hypothetical protein
MAMLQATTAMHGFGSELNQGTKGESLAMGLQSGCDRAVCTRRVVTALGDRDYCFDHFCSRCYELLEKNERVAESGMSEDDGEEFLALDECAQRALEIALSETKLNNLDRARLLDILLWTGDLTSSMRYRKVAAAAYAGSTGKGGTSGL